MKKVKFHIFLTLAVVILMLKIPTNVLADDEYIPKPTDVPPSAGYYM